MYDPLMKYTNEDFRILSHDELFILFKQAKNAAVLAYGIKLIKKVQRDVSNMRILLSGFNAVHNEEQNVR